MSIFANPYKAIDRYDPQHKTKFETYAYIRIRGAMLDGIRSEDWIPRSVRLRQSEIEKTKQEMEAICGCKVLESDVLEALGIDPNDYHKHCNRYKPAVKSSIETSACMNFDLQGGNKKDFNRYLVAKHEISPNVLLLKQEFLSKLIGKNLTLPERRIIYMYYYESKTMKEIAEIIDMSESRVSQIHHDVLERLKTRIKVNPSYFGDDLLECMCNFSEVNQLV